MEDHRSAGRRNALRWITGAGAVVALDLLTLSGCSEGAAEGPRELSIPLADLPPGQRVRVAYGEIPVELLRTESGVTARVLQCTHIGCEVRWDESAGLYRCPCHGAEFDSSGTVRSGPPPRPLDTLQVRITEDVVHVGG